MSLMIGGYLTINDGWRSLLMGKAILMGWYILMKFITIIGVITIRHYNLKWRLSFNHGY